MEVLNLKNWVISYSLMLFPKDIYVFSTTVPVKFFNWNIFYLYFKKYLLKSSSLISIVLPISNFQKVVWFIFLQKIINSTLQLFSLTFKRVFVSYILPFCNFEANTCQNNFPKIKFVTRKLFTYLFF